MKEDIAYQLQLVLDKTDPVNGSRWRHYRGGIYKVLMKAVESNEPHRVKVIYQSDEGYLWEHPLEEWEKEVKLEDGTVVSRFVPLYNEFDIIMKLEDQWDC